MLTQEGEQLCLVGINLQELLPVSRQICRPINPSLDALAKLVSDVGLRLFYLYWSQTISILLAKSSWLLT